MTHNSAYAHKHTDQTDSGVYRSQDMEKHLFDLMQIIKLEPDLSKKINMVNNIKIALHEVSPFKNEPVDCVLWVKNDLVHQNDYNPNSVAPPEMNLLKVSIDSDGYTQPIVSMKDGVGFEVIDGFHRHRVGKECEEIRNKVYGYLPIVYIRGSQEGKADRMASTVRHNRARGKHKVEAMSDIVVELKRRNWSDDKIAKNLGMDSDEVLRLCQITGLVDVFKDDEFSSAWEVEKLNSSEEGVFVEDVILDFEPENNGRIFHTWEKWECYKAGMFSEKMPKGVSFEDGEDIYRDFLSDLSRFKDSLEVVISSWSFSCEHNLTNEKMNRIAWLGQAAVAQAIGLPAICRGGYYKLNKQQQLDANNLALEYLNKWLIAHGKSIVDFQQAGGKTEVELY